MIRVVMITDEDIIDRQRGRQCPMDGLDGVAGLGAAGDIGLVGDYKQSESVRLQVEQRRRNLGQQFEFFHSGRRKRLAIAHYSAVEDAVAVEEDCRTKLPIAESSRLPLGLALLHLGM